MLYDLDGDQVINLDELKLMMEKLGQPKTHVGKFDRVLWRETSEEIYISTILIVFDFRTQKNDC
jgi:hypothetical protein